ncbi:MAG: hypothetical protein CMJ90_15435 [Planctomycetes bacterium]|nr:hypothetical protein [Planctomycetota bacterium]
MKGTLWDGPAMRCGRYEIREATAADRDGILTSFNRVFSEGNPEFVPRPEASWDWAFLGNPAGRQTWIAVADDGTIAAHFAGWPTRVRRGDDTVLFSQIVDSFTHPDHRRGLKHPGIFTRTANAFIDCLVWPHRNAILFGLPVPDHFRLGARQIGYEVVRPQLQITLRADQELIGGDPTETTVEEVMRVDDAVERLFHRCLDHETAMAIRDAAFVNWRYADHPSHRYHIGVVKDGDELRGLAVYRDALFSDVEQGVLVDWLVPTDDPDTARALLAWAREHTRAAGREQCSLVIASTDPWWEPLQLLGMKALRTKYILVYGNLCRDPRFDEAWLRAHWRYTLGETDIV